MKFLKIITVILSTLFSFFIIYLGLVFYNFSNFNDKQKKFFYNLEISEFHKKYSLKLHHTRGDNWGTIYDLLIENHNLNEVDLSDESNKKISKKHQLIFNYIYETKTDDTILFQGDSWIEQYNFYKKSKDSIKRLGINTDMNIINAGISSFSPTLMKLQYKILKEDFNINPTIVVGMIDQTDIGDEICRYKNNRVLKQNEVIAVKPAIHEFPIKWKLTELYYSKKNNFFKSISLTNFKFKQFTMKAKNKFYKFFDKNIKYCAYKDIQSYLINSNNKNEKYFANSVKDYLRMLNDDKTIKKIVLVTFPHKFHFKSNGLKNVKYNVNVSNIVEKIENDFNKLIHINFSKILDSKVSNINDIWLENDISSHLKPYYHDNLITKEIINKIKNTK